jgi:hypothetical protein
MIAGVAIAGAIAAPADAPAGANATARPVTAKQIRTLIRRYRAKVEIVRFANPGQPAVTVVRGQSFAASAAVFAATGRRSSAAAGPNTGAAGGERPIGTRSRRLRAASIGRRVAVLVLRGGAAGADAATTTDTPRIETVSFANGDGTVIVLRGMPVEPVPAALSATASRTDLGLFPTAPAADLDRIAFAVDGAESSHGADPGMWRPALEGPQGPMQVTAAAALDSGGGDRFDLITNRQLGRAYLARLYRRYGNWADAVAAYNWGPGNLDAWIARGRPAAGLPLSVEQYRDRVLRDGGMAQGMPRQQGGLGSSSMR